MAGEKTVPWADLIMHIKTLAAELYSSWIHTSCLWILGSGGCFFSAICHQRTEKTIFKQNVLFLFSQQTILIIILQDNCFREVWNLKGYSTSNGIPRVFSSYFCKSHVRKGVCDRRRHTRGETWQRGLKCANITRIILILCDKMNKHKEWISSLPRSVESMETKGRYCATAC